MNQNNRVLALSLVGCGIAPAAGSTAETESEPAVSMAEPTSEADASMEMPTAETEQNDDYYSGVTAMDKDRVEAFAASVRQAYLDQDWTTISTLIAYPITMYPDVKVNNAEEFLAYMKDKTVDESDMATMEAEACKDMFYNGQGICMGSGSVWILDPNYMTDKEPVLQIIEVSGIVNK